MKKGGDLHESKEIVVCNGFDRNCVNGDDARDNIEVLGGGQ